MCQLSPVPFHGDTIFCIDYQNQPFTPMRPIVENMGLDWSAQAAKFRANKERWTVAMIATVAQDGIEREMLSMPVRKLPAWLNSINPKKVRVELRPKIELYQAESDDALWNYWMNGRAERTVDALPASDSPLTPDQQCTLQAIIRAKIEALPEDERKGRGLYPQIWSRFNNHFRIARYCQLPQSRMSEAIDYLMKMELAPKALPPTDKESLAVSRAIEPAPEQALAVTTLDAKTYASGKQFFDDVSKLRRNAEGIREALHIFARPGGRSVFLPHEKQMLYDNANEAANVAVTSLNQAIYALRMIYNIKAHVSFSR